jgi:hypothetical protein
MTLNLLQSLCDTTEHELSGPCKVWIVTPDHGGFQMTRHALTLEEQLRGVRAAIASPRTPPGLRKGLRERLSALEQKFDRQQQKQKALSHKRKKPVGLLDWLGL